MADPSIVFCKMRVGRISLTPRCRVYHPNPWLHTGLRAQLLENDKSCRFRSRTSESDWFERLLVKASPPNYTMPQGAESEPILRRSTISDHSPTVTSVPGRRGGAGRGVLLHVGLRRIFVEGAERNLHVQGVERFSNQTGGPGWTVLSCGGTCAAPPTLALAAALDCIWFYLVFTGLDAYRAASLSQNRSGQIFAGFSTEAADPTIVGSVHKGKWILGTAKWRSRCSHLAPTWLKFWSARRLLALCSEHSTRGCPPPFPLPSYARKRP